MPFRVALGLVAALALGIFLGGHPSALPGFVRSALVGDGDSRVVGEVIDLVGDDYYRKVSDDKLTKAALDGLVASLGDQYSVYHEPAAGQAFRDSLDNVYEGIGIVVDGDKRGLRIVRVYAGSPARKAGLRAGDVIVAVGGRRLAGLGVDAASKPIKGKPGTEVTLRVLRDGRERTVKARRGRVDIPVVASALREQDGRKVGVVSLANFEGHAGAQVRKALESLRAKGARGFVLDLRGNGGGQVPQAREVAGAFLRGGPVVTMQGRAVKKRTLTATGETVVPSAPLAVLVDGNTASASEIVTGALQDRDRATVVGSRTFGKGVFQAVFELSNGGVLTLTEGHYFTPDGRNLGGPGVKQGKGIAPDVKASDDPATRADEALAAALRVVAGKLGRR